MRRRRWRKATTPFPPSLLSTHPRHTLSLAGSHFPPPPSNTSSHLKKYKVKKNKKKPQHKHKHKKKQEPSLPTPPHTHPRRKNEFQTRRETQEDDGTESSHTKKKRKQACHTTHTHTLPKETHAHTRTHIMFPVCVFFIFFSLEFVGADHPPTAAHRNHITSRALRRAGSLPALRGSLFLPPYGLPLLRPNKAPRRSPITPSPPPSSACMRVCAEIRRGSFGTKTTLM